MPAQDLVSALPKLWRYCLGLTQQRSTADDLAQATCLRALEQIDRFKTLQFKDRWLMKVARNLWINQLKSERVRRGGGLVPVDCIALEDLTASPELDAFVGQVFSAVMELPEAQRDTVLLVYVEGWSYKETAEALDIPIGTVMSRLSDARRKLSPLNRETAVSTNDLDGEKGRHGSV